MKRTRPNAPPLFFLSPLLPILAAGAACPAAPQEFDEIGPNLQQPPAKVLAAAGVRPGMTIGEVGAGRRRYAIFLSEKVGPTGKIFAEDIDRSSLDHLRGRLARAKIEREAEEAGFEIVRQDAFLESDSI